MCSPGTLTPKGLFMVLLLAERCSWRSTKVFRHLQATQPSPEGHRTVTCVAMLGAQALVLACAMWLRHYLGNVNVAALVV